MKLDTTAPLYDFDGKALDDLTLGKVCTDALIVNLPGDEASGSEKADRFVLACKLRGESPVDVKSEDVSTLKKLVGKLYGPLVVGQVYELLEGNPNPLAPKE